MRPSELHILQLHCETLPSAPSSPVRDSRPFRAALRALKGIRSRDCDRTSRPQTLAGLCPSDSPRGENIARESQCQRERQCPESAYINIIPSGLCNKSPRAALVSASHTIRIMLSTLPQRVASVLPPNSRARRRQERSSLREGTTPPLRRSLRTFRVLRITGINSPAPLPQSCLRHGRCAPLLPLRTSIGGRWYARPESAAPNTVGGMRLAFLAFNIRGMQASCRLTQHPLLGRSRP